MRTIDQIETLIARGDLKEALAHLSELVATSEELTRQRNAVITLSARYHQLQRRRISGLISSGEAQITENQIRYNTLELIDMFRRELGEVGDTDSPSTVKELRGALLSILELPEDHKFKIFLALSEPGGKPLFLGREIREIKHALRKSEISGRFELIPSFATTIEDFMDEFDEVRPHIVHFAGHGNSDGIYLEDKNHNATLLSNDALSKIFNLFKESVTCVVFNSCLSEEQGKVIKDYIPYVIGTTAELTNKTSVSFSSSFYSSFGRGNTIPFAFEYAKVYLTTQGLNPDHFRIFENGGNNSNS